MHDKLVHKLLILAGAEIDSDDEFFDSEEFEFSDQEKEDALFIINKLLTYVKSSLTYQKSDSIDPNYEQEILNNEYVKLLNQVFHLDLRALIRASLNFLSSDTILQLTTIKDVNMDATINSMLTFKPYASDYFEPTRESYSYADYIQNSKGTLQEPVPSLVVKGASMTEKTIFEKFEIRELNEANDLLNDLKRYIKPI